MNKYKIIIYFVFIPLMAASCSKNSTPRSPASGQAQGQQASSTGYDQSPVLTSNTMQITSPSFQNNQSIPEQYACDGKSVSIPLNFSGVPDGAKSLAMIMYDPDVPKNLLPSGLFVHWVIFNMPPSTTELKENQTPPGTQGNNGSGKSVYTGPCPPDRQHRYFFMLYALDAMLDLPHGATKDQVEAAMQGHIMAQAQLVGLYNKKGNPQ